VIGVLLPTATRIFPNSNHLIVSFPQGRIDESLLAPGILELPSTLERYAGIKEDACDLLSGVQDFLRRKYDVAGLEASEKLVWRADKVFNFLLNVRQ